MGRRKGKKKQSSMEDQPEIIMARVYMAGNKPVTFHSPIILSRDETFLYIIHNSMGMAYNIAHMVAYECEFEKDEQKS